ncbi:TonB-dependent receptor, partial [gut metagenome]
RTNAMDIGAGFEYKIFDWLTFVSNNKVGFNNYTSENYYDPKAVGQESLQGTIHNSSSNTRTIYTSQLLRFLKTFNEVHEISAYL